MGNLHRVEVSIRHIKTGYGLASLPPALEHKYLGLCNKRRIGEILMLLLQSGYSVRVNYASSRQVILVRATLLNPLADGKKSIPPREYSSLNPVSISVLEAKPQSKPEASDVRPSPKSVPQLSKRGRRASG